MEHRLFHSDTWCATGKSIRLCCAVGFEVGWGVGVQGWGGGRSGRVVLIDNGSVYQSKAADALVQVKTTTFGTNVGLNMLLNISSRYFGGLFWSRQLRGLPSSDGYFFLIKFYFLGIAWYYLPIFVHLSRWPTMIFTYEYKDRIKKYKMFGFQIQGTYLSSQVTTCGPFY